MNADKEKGMTVNDFARCKFGRGRHPGLHPRSSAFICGLAVFLVCSAGASAQQLFKCVQDGKTVYQGEKCPTTAKESTLRIQEPATPAPTQDQAKATEEKSDRQSAKEYEMIAEVTTGFNLCSEFDPDFRAKYLTAFDEWGGRNAAAYKAFTANPKSAQDVRDRMNRGRERTAGDDLEGQAKREAVCARVKAVLQ